MYCTLRKNNDQSYFSFLSDVDECAALNPCKNGGRCQNTRGGYSCSCAQRFAGKNCDQSMFRIDCTQPIFVNLCVCVNWYIPFFVPWFYIHHFDIAPTWENSPHIAAPPQVFPWNDIWGTSTEIPCWWRVSSRSGECFWRVEVSFPRSTTSQKYYQNLESDRSSLWNFYARSSDVICIGYHV